MLLALDCSTVATGFSFGGPKDGSPKGGVWRLPGAEDHVFPMTCGRLARSIMDLCKMLKVEHVAIEKPIIAMGAKNAAHTMRALLELTGAAKAAANMAGASVSEPAIGSIRKSFIGVGNLNSAAAKAAVQARCKQLGWAFQDGNHADSNALWCHAMSLRYPAWAPLQTPLFKGAA